MLLTRKTKRNITLFFLAILCAVIFGFIDFSFISLSDLGSVIYCGIIIAWLLSVRERIVSDKVRRILCVMAGFLLALMILRIMRYDLSDWSAPLGRYAWYLYYVPFVVVPLLCFRAAVWTDRSKPDGLIRAARWAYLPASILFIAVLTNDLHQLVFRLEKKGVTDYKYHHAVLYWVFMGWCVIMTLLSFAVLMQRCRLSRCRRLWFIPVLVTAVALFFIIWYLIEGGSPVFFGNKLYKIQEIYALLYIGLWESYIQIGLLPSNTGYGQLFALSHIDAELRSAEGGKIYRSMEGTAEEDSENVVLLSRPVLGGEIRWKEDHSAIRKLNERLREVTEGLHDENEMIAEENRIASERASYEAQNRLYDRIAQIIRPKAEAIEPLLDPEAGEEAFRRDLSLAAVLGAYIKRRANLEILMGREEDPSAGELALAVRESLEYAEGCGLTCELRGILSSPADAEVLISSMRFLRRSWNGRWIFAPQSP